MEIVYKQINELKPYENNPRINDNAVDAVAESIKEFGFKVPIVIDKSNVIIAGHTRLKASKKLGLKQVPCIIADDLSEDQVKAFRLVENKTNELATWDDELLMQELEDLNFNLDEYGFNFNDLSLDNIEYQEENEEQKINERNKTYSAYNMELYDENEASYIWQMPVIKCDNYIPKRLIGFNYAKSSEDKNTGIHFFIDDYQFERCWNNPEEYLEILRDYDCVLSPDFSLYLDMALPVKVWNVYRSRLLGQYWQRNGLKVIPTISWAEEKTFDFAFEGIPEKSIVAVSTIGVKREDECFKYFKSGMDEMIKRIKPKTILCYGGKVDYDCKGIEVIYFENEVTERMKSLRGDENGGVEQSL